MEDLCSWRELFAKVIIGTLAFTGLALLISLLASPLATGLAPQLEVALWDGLTSQLKNVIVSVGSVAVSLLLFSFLIHSLSLTLRFGYRLALGISIILSVLVADWSRYPEGFLVSPLGRVFLGSERAAFVLPSSFVWAPLALVAFAFALQLGVALRFAQKQQQVLLLYRRGNVLRELEREAKRFSMSLVCLVWSALAFATLAVLLTPRSFEYPLPSALAAPRVFVFALQGLTEIQFKEPEFLKKTKQVVGFSWSTWPLLPGSGESLPRWVEYLTGRVAPRWGISTNGVSRLPAQWQAQSVLNFGPRNRSALFAADWAGMFLDRFPFGFDDMTAPQARFDTVLRAVLADNLVIAGTLTRVFRFGEASLSLLRGEAQGVLARAREQLAAAEGMGSPLVAVVALSRKVIQPQDEDFDTLLSSHLEDLKRAGWLQDSSVVLLGDVSQWGQPGVLAIASARALTATTPWARGVDVAPTLAELSGNKLYSAEDGVRLVAASDEVVPRHHDLKAGVAYWEGFEAESAAGDLTVDPLDHRNFVAASAPWELGRKVRVWRHLKKAGAGDLLTVPFTGLPVSERGSLLYGEMAQFLGKMGTDVVETESRHLVFVEADIQ